ncbi:MAG: GxxExxY protein [Candidatus Doudnabacteria bacterium]|nr:GxxExxY protein [Candidatus Doudnabacteria bacterium]
MLTNSQKTVLFYPELSYEITGALYKVHNELGMYGREKQYGNIFEQKLKDKGIAYIREGRIGDSGNIVDFIVENKIIIELKAKRILLKEDYEQLQRYLQSTGIKLGILVNFRNKYIHPVRVVKIDHATQHSF